MFAVFVYASMISFVPAVSGSCYFHDETLPVPMYAHQGIFSAVKNAVYLFGGLTGTTVDNRASLNKVYKWDLSDPSSWFVEIGTTPTSNGFWSYSQNAVLVNDQVFFIGIYHDDWLSGKMFVYDLNTESFISEEKRPMPYPMMWGCLTTDTTHIFMVDGDDNSETDRLPIIQVYDIAADAWQSQVLDTGPVIPIRGWRAQYCSLVGDALYVLGGLHGSIADGVYRINTLTLESEQLNVRLPDPQAFGVSIYDGDRNLYLFGSFPFKRDVLTLNLDTLSVSTAFNSQQSYADAPISIINGSVYRFGGELNTDYNANDKVEICDLPTDMPTQSPTKLPTNSPTAFPTVTPSALPTAAPSPIPTQSPTKTPTHVPSSDPTRSPTFTPTFTPTLTPTAMPSRSPAKVPSSLEPSRTVTTMSATRVRPRPSPPINNDHDEYGVGTTIKLDAVLPTNDTDRLITALYEYAQTTINSTNCSERINVSSQETESDKTVIKMSIVTCSEATETQLRQMMNGTVVLEVVLGIVTHAEVEEIEVESMYDDSNAPSAAVPAHDEKKRYYWYLILLGVILLVAGVAVFGLCFVWRRKKNQRKDVARNMKRAGPTAATPIAENVTKGTHTQTCGVELQNNEQMELVLGLGATRVMPNATPGDQAPVSTDQGTSGPVPATYAEVFEAMHVFNAQGAHMMAMPAVINTADDGEDDDDDDDDDDLFGTYGKGATDTGLGK